MCDYRETCSARELRKDDFICFGTPFDCRMFPFMSLLEETLSDLKKDKEELKVYQRDNSPSDEDSQIMKDKDVLAEYNRIFFCK